METSVGAVISSPVVPVVQGAIDDRIVDDSAVDDGVSLGANLDAFLRAGLLHLFGTDRPLAPNLALLSNHVPPDVRMLLQISAEQPV